MKRFALSGLIVIALIVVLARVFQSERGGDVRLTGIVSANEALVASELSGRIRELRVSEGDWVDKGQVVAVLVTDEIDAERQSRLATIDELSSRVEQGREKVRLERERLERSIEGATAQLRTAESQREESRAKLEQAQRELTHTMELLEEGLVPRQRRERQESMVEVASAELQTEEDRVGAARAELELHRASERQVRVMEQEVEQTEARLAQARAELDQITVRLGYTELRSPLDGMVSVRVAREGEFVASGEPVVTVVDLDDVWVRAEVEETLVTRLVVGQPLEVRLASDEALTGRVTFISPEAEFATQRDVDRVKRDIRTFGIKVSVPNPDRRVHPGMTAYVILPEQLTSAPVPIPERHPAGPYTTEERGPAPAPEPTLPTGPATEAALEGPLRPGPEETGPAEAGELPEPIVPTPANAASLPSSALAEAEEGDVELEALLAQMELDGEPSVEELARLETALLAELEEEGDEPAPGASLPSGPEQTPGAVSRRSAPVELPPWAQPRSANSESTVPTAGGAPELRLEGISTVDGRPVAIINGTRVFEGESVAGARVLSISERAVRLDCEGRQITLSF